VVNSLVPSFFEPFSNIKNNLSFFHGTPSIPFLYGTASLRLTHTSVNDSPLPFLLRRIALSGDLPPSDAEGRQVKRGGVLLQRRALPLQELGSLDELPIPLCWKVTSETTSVFSCDGLAAGFFFSGACPPPQK